MSTFITDDKVITTAGDTPITVGDIANEARERLAALGGTTAATATSTLEALAKDGDEVFLGAEDYGRQTSEPGSAADGSLDLDADDVFTE